MKRRERLPQRRLAILLREALVKGDRNTVLDLIRDHPRGVRSSHVRHNIPTDYRPDLDEYIAEAGIEQYQAEDR